MHDTKRKQYEQLARKYHIKLVFIIAERKEHGHPVNGYLRERVIYLNYKLGEDTDQILGHELTHLIRDEGQEYREIQRILFEVARRRNEYNSRLESITELYKGIDTDLQEELTADLTGDYIFNEDFVNELVQDKTAFQKVYDHIKEWLKVVTSGSQEYKQIYEAKKLFEKALDDSTSKVVTDTNKKSYYTYDNLSKLPDIAVESYKPSAFERVEKNNRSEIFATIIENAKENGATKYTDKSLSIVNDIDGRESYVNSGLLKHSEYGNNNRETVTAMENIYSLLKTAILINKSYEEYKGNSGDIIRRDFINYFNIFSNADRNYIVRINVVDGEIKKVTSIVYSVGTKKGITPLGSTATEDGRLLMSYPFTISVSDFLSEINRNSDFRKNLSLEYF